MRCPCNQEELVLGRNVWHLNHAVSRQQMFGFEDAYEEINILVPVNCLDFKVRSGAGGSYAAFFYYFCFLYNLSQTSDSGMME